MVEAVSAIWLKAVVHFYGLSRAAEVAPSKSDQMMEDMKIQMLYNFFRSAKRVRSHRNGIADRCLAACLIAITCVCSPSVLAKERKVSGVATVVNGDTIKIDDQRIRFYSVDAPEISQTCKGENGSEWNCGQKAFETLIEFIDGKQTRCDLRSADANQPFVATCYNARGFDLGAEMISRCLAWAFLEDSYDYLLLENKAVSSGCGIWSDANEQPWKYRERRWDLAKKAAPNGCPIKGVVSGGTSYYYVPWSPWYADVNVDETRGGRWFCSEEEAFSMGWRAPLWR